MVFGGGGGGGRGGIGGLTVFEKNEGKNGATVFNGIQGERYWGFYCI